MIKANFFLEESFRISSFLIEGHEDKVRGEDALVCASSSSSVRSFIRLCQKEGWLCEVKAPRKGCVSFCFKEKDIKQQYEGICRLLLQIFEDLEKENPKTIKVSLSFIKRDICLS